MRSAPDAPNIVATCVDIDREPLAFASDIAQQVGVARHFTFAQDNVVRLCQGRGRTALGPQALIYSLGLTDYLEDAFVVDLMNWAYEILLPGGTLIVGSVTAPTRQSPNLRASEVGFRSMVVAASTALSSGYANSAPERLLGEHAKRWH